MPGLSRLEKDWIIGVTLFVTAAAVILLSGVTFMLLMEFAP